MLESAECSNKTNGSGICDFDLQMCEDDNEFAEFMEIEQNEFSQKVKDWQEEFNRKKEAKEKKITEEDWICTSCQALNKMNYED